MKLYCKENFNFQVFLQECLLFTDSDDNRTDRYSDTRTHAHTHTFTTPIICRLHICQLVLASGEDKLQRLILQKKFTEAETYALSNDLDVEVSTFNHSKL